MQQAIDEAGNIWEVDAQGNPLRYVGNANQQRGGMQIKPADPTRQYDLQKAQADAAKASADAAIAGQMNQVQLAKAQADLAKAQTETSGNKLTPAARADAINGYKYADQLDQIVSQLEQQYAAGPGATSGLGGIQDYLPLARNQQFDSTANAARGIVGQALGFTGGQLNSIQEAEASVGPYLPKAGDRDEVIQDKIARLRSLASTARQRSVAILGGVPDANGQITPLDANGPNILPQAAGTQAAAPMQVGGVTSKGGLIEIPQLRGIENQVADMIGRGASTDQIVGFLRQQYQPYGAEVGPELQGYLGDIVRKHQANPRQPVKSLGTGWENLYYRKAPDTAQANTFMGIDPDSGLGTGVMTAANAATGGLPAYLAGKQDVMNAAAQERPGAALAGEVAGGVAAMTGINGAAGALGKAGTLLTRGGGIGGDMLYGATRGGLENGPTGAITGALAAGVGNKVGGSVVNTAGRVARGVSDPAVNYLSERGIPLTLGQLLGNRGMTGKLLNRLESAPVLGDMMAARRTDSIEGFNREALRQAIEPVGGNITATGREGLDQAYGAVDQGYDSALAGQQFSGNEPQFIQEMGAAIQRGQAVPKLGEDFSYIMQNDVAPMFDSSGVLTGDRLQAALQGIRKARSGFAGQPMGQYAGNALTDAENAITGMVGRQAPDVMPRLSAANKAYGNVSTIGDAVNTAVNQGGLFTPAQLGRAAVNNTKKFGGKRAAATGDVPFRALQEAGQQVLPSTVPDSGTAGRAASLLLPGVLGGSAVGADQLGASPSVTVPLAVLAALSSKTGAKVAQKALTGRSPTAVKAGNALIRNRRKGGLFGAALTAGAVMPQLSQ